MSQIEGCGLRDGGIIASSLEKHQVAGLPSFFAPEYESTTPNLERNVSQIGGCGLDMRLKATGIHPCQIELLPNLKTPR